MLYAIPNGHVLGVKRGRRANRDGRRPGVPDVCLPVARGSYHALYIELKRVRGGRVELEQQEWLEMLTAAGNRACVARGWEAARQLIVHYLTT